MRRRTSQAAERRGVILLVVVASLTLLTLFGLAFVMYATAAATRSRVYREAQSRTRNGDIREKALLEATATWHDYLGQLVYDVNDDAAGRGSVLRAQSLARTMYGWYVDPNNPQVYALNDRPYTGVGRINAPDQVNYSLFWDPAARRGPFARPDFANLSSGGRNGDLNVNYTYPDRNNMFLARLAMDSTTGQLYIDRPSYRRWWNENAADPRRQLHHQPSWMGQGYPADPVESTDSTTTPNAGKNAGHVKTLDYLAGTTDSIWIDINGPIHDGPDGRRYKCMIAPVVLDLDGRINVNTAGNFLLDARPPVSPNPPLPQTTASNMGWGHWEVNPWKLSSPVTFGTITISAGDQTDWVKLFTDPTNGRYMPHNGPFPQYSVPTGQNVRNTYPVDFNGRKDPPQNGYSSRFDFPGETNPTTMTPYPQYRLFPSYDTTNSYGNAVPKETTVTGATGGAENHPSLYNPLRPFGGRNRAFGVADLEGVLRRDSDPKGLTLSSSLLTLLAGNIGTTAEGANAHHARYRRASLTTHSMDLQRPGSFPTSLGTYQITTGRVPSGSAGTFSTPTPTTGEFDTVTGRSALGALGINLRRRLPDFPRTLDGSSRFNDSPSDPVNPYPISRAALAARREYAKEIFDRLCRVTGVSTTATAASALNEFDARRFLAQLAVNIVDFLDNDDYSTPFEWTTPTIDNTDPLNPKTVYYFVYGVELPRLVMNEYYAQWDNHGPQLVGAAGSQTQPAGNYRLNVWVELFNPLSTDTNAGPEGAAARLQNTAGAVYRLRLTQKGDPTLFARDRADGAVDPAVVGNVGVVSTWGTRQTVNPSNGAYKTPDGGNDGFYVLGPDPDYTNARKSDPWMAGTLLTKSHTTGNATDGDPTTYQLTVPIPLEADATDTSNNPTVAGQEPALILERLANPYLPAEPNQASPLYNPYIAVDVVTKLKVEDGRVATKDTDRSATLSNAQDRHSWGKYHPYAAVADLWKQQLPATVPTDRPHHTFFRHNAREDDSGTGTTTLTAAGNTIQVPYDTLVHLDRPLVSVGELLHVSPYKPHELTQAFITTDGAGNMTGRFQHRTPWTDDSNRLARFLDHVMLPSWTEGIRPHGRIPGKVNINTLRDPNVFRAICDAVAAADGGPKANRFSQDDIDAVYTAITTSRDSGGRDGNPFLSLATAQSTIGTTSYGIANTVLRQPAGATPVGWNEKRLIETGTGTPEQTLRRYELLTKIMNHLTTRSNVYAVWVTVGFFEVVDESTTPVKLGAEISWPDIGPIRHRMFGLIDRTALQVWPKKDDQNNVLCKLKTAIAGPTSPAVTSTETITLSSWDPVTAAYVDNGNVINPNTNRTWVPQAGALITIDPDTDTEETVELRRVGAVFQATFTKAHLRDAVIISRGNPGPWIRYDPGNDMADGVILQHLVVE